MDSHTDGGCAEAWASLREIFVGAEDVLLPQRISVEEMVLGVDEVLISGFAMGFNLDFIWWLLREPKFAQAVLLFVEDRTFRTFDIVDPNFDGYWYVKGLYHAALVAQATGDPKIVEFSVRVARRGLTSLETLPDQNWRDEWMLERLNEFLQKHASEFNDGRDSEFLEGLQSVASELHGLRDMDYPANSVALRHLVERIRGE